MFSLGPLRVQRLMLEFAGEDDACGGMVDICLESTEIFSLTLEGLLKARLLCHDHVRFQRM